jgi:hypothetical protein
MQWNVRIVDEDGKPVSEEDVIVPVSILEKMGPDSAMLRGIDPYLDTTFNPLQIELFFIKEWEDLASRVEPTDRAVWETVLAYAKRCLEPHLYLKFIGD